MSLTDLMRPLDRDERRGSRKQLARVQRSAERMNRLIHDLLDVFSIDGGSLSLEECQLEAGPVISEALDALLPLAAAKSLSLKNEVPVALPAIMADSGRFQQVLANLLSNAIKFTPEGGTITVGAKSAADEVIFSIADTGPGIDEAHLPHLFERVWQTKSTAHMGSGLGLFIVKGIVESHGGKVWAQSAVGHGTTLLFTLPIAQPAPPRSGHRPEQTRATIRRRSERSRFLGKSGVGEAFPSSEPIESSPPPHRS